MTVQLTWQPVLRSADSLLVHCYQQEFGKDLAAAKVSCSAKTRAARTAKSDDDQELQSQTNTITAIWLNSVPGQKAASHEGSTGGETSSCSSAAAAAAAQHLKRGLPGAIWHVVFAGQGTLPERGVSGSCQQKVRQPDKGS